MGGQDGTSTSIVDFFETLLLLLIICFFINFLQLILPFFFEQVCKESKMKADNDIVGNMSLPPPR
jgi:hypothetical protein